ncbi:ABC transporter substrate-binding protein [Natronosporangium hydrolyticum]|uniref:ABC transporter substrate-binding protein n=1 Tax=Natronosporangium hydrolyticum TaxID=2811111 RepID=A0A895YAS9_9ACTN|nr:ABC transporter substrate-binding protein [Natronosporangium hydrolyticum]QSB14884.1 ABC transporter substrate-binding protein [Natronosporangium hydrolyticum]
MSGIHRRRALQLFGAMGTIGLASACAQNGAGDDTAGTVETPVRIGLLLPATGGYRQIGDEIRNGFRGYLSTTDGRLGGHPVTEQEEDEGGSPEATADALERLVDAEVNAIVGVVDSAALLAISADVERAHTPLLSAHASPLELTGVPYIWRTSYVNDEPGLALGRHLVQAVTGPVSVVAQDDPFGREAVAGLQEAFAEAQASDRLAEPIFTEEERQPDEDYFDDALSQLAQQAPAATFAAYAGAAAVEFVGQYLAAGFDPTELYAPGHLTEGAVLAEYGDDLIGVHTAANYAPELRGGANRTFATRYRAEHGPPSSFAVAGYDAALVLDAAIRRTDGDPSPRQINLALGEVGLVDSPRGRWQFNQNRTPTQKWFLRRVESDGPTTANLVVQELGTLG